MVSNRVHPPPSSAPPLAAASQSARLQVRTEASQDEVRSSNRPNCSKAGLNFTEEMGAVCPVRQASKSPVRKAKTKPSKVSNAPLATNSAVESTAKQENCTPPRLGTDIVRKLRYLFVVCNNNYSFSESKIYLRKTLSRGRKHGFNIFRCDNLIQILRVTQWNATQRKLII